MSGARPGSGTGHAPAMRGDGLCLVFCPERRCLGRTVRTWKMATVDLCTDRTSGPACAALPGAPPRTQDRRRQVPHRPRLVVLSDPAHGIRSLSRPICAFCLHRYTTCARQLTAATIADDGPSPPTTSKRQGLGDRQGRYRPEQAAARDVGTRVARAGRVVSGRRRREEARRSFPVQPWISGPSTPEISPLATGPLGRNPTRPLFATSPDPDSDGVDRHGRPDHCD